MNETKEMKKEYNFKHLRLFESRDSSNLNQSIRNVDEREKERRRQKMKENEKIIQKFHILFSTAIVRNMPKPTEERISKLWNSHSIQYFLFSTSSL